MIPPGLEPGTLRVLGARDNHYTTESHRVETLPKKNFTFGSKPVRGIRQRGIFQENPLKKSKQTFRISDSVKSFD